jgi:hypothetical protein
MNNIKVTEKANDAQRMNSFYDKLQQNIDLQVDREDLLVVKCNLFIRFENFVKNLYKNDPNNIFIKCLKINSNVVPGWCVPELSELSETNLLLLFST